MDQPVDHSSREEDVQPEDDFQDDAPSQRFELENQLKTGANWFFWIAALSVVNSVIILAQGQWSFIIGLGVTMVIDVIALEIMKEVETPNLVLVVAFVLDLIVAGVFALFGVLSRKRHTWAFILGMFLYGLDGLLFLLLGDILSFGFHLFALWCLWAGLKACRTLNAETPQPMVESASAG